MTKKTLNHIVNHLGEDREHYQNAVVPPIYQTGMFAFKSVADLREGMAHELERPFYTRGFNPTVSVLRQKLAALEQTDDALVFSSGSAAVAASVLSEAKQGDHIVCVQKPYSWTYKLINDYLSNYGVEASFVDGRNAQNVIRAVKDNTTLIFLESPNSVTFEMQDIQAIRNGVGPELTIAIDNSYSSPIFQNPVKFGANIIIHSASKYIGGHSDVIAGVVCSDQRRIDSMFEKEYMTLGSVISPNDAWLLLRGIRTLPARMEAVAKSAQAVLAYLEGHPKVEKINYPFSPSNPQLTLARKQMSNAGGLFSMQVKANSMQAVEDFCNNLPSFLITCSWGGYESLLFPTCALYDSQNYGKTDLPWNLIRFYIGLEDPEEIKEEFESAFKFL